MDTVNIIATTNFSITARWVNFHLYREFEREILVSHTGDNESSCLLGRDGLSLGKNFFDVSKVRNVKNLPRNA
jgi:hypothetical protein